MQKVAERVFVVPLGYVNVVVLGDREKFSLVDAGIPGSLKRLEQQLNRAGFELQNLQSVLITHAHPDHYGVLAELLERKKVPVYAHPREIPVLLGQEKAALPPRETLPLGQQILQRVITSMKRPPTIHEAQPMVEGQVLQDILPGLTVIELPGHAPGQVGFWIPSSRTLIAADALMRGGGKCKLPLQALTVSMRDAARSAQRIVDLDVERLIVGHGKPILEKAHQELHELEMPIQKQLALAGGAR